MEFKNLLAKYNAEIDIEGGGDGFSSELVISLNNKEVIRVFDGISHIELQNLINQNHKTTEQ